MNSSDPSISTGFASADRILGTGGLPRRAITELYGLPECGKSTVALHWIASAQRAQLSAVVVDAEHTFDPRWAQDCGVRLQDLVLVNPETGEQALAMAESLLRSFTVDLLVIDSAAALGPDSEVYAAVEDEPLDAHTEFVARYLRRLRAIAERAGTSILVVNQMRMRLRPGDPETTAAGRALSLHSSIRIRLRRDQDQLLLTTIKNKLAEPFQEAVLKLDGSVLCETHARFQPGREQGAKANRVTKTG